MLDRYLLAGVAGLIGLAAPASAQMPWFDAGNQAMIQHQGDLLEQQTAPDNGGGTSAERPKAASGAAANLLAACQARAKAQLRPEYDKRLKAQGQAAADAWLRQAASAAGRWAGERVKAGKSC